jgi:hypothetical protein
MKKTKKFEDGGPTGGRYVDMGDSQVFVPDTPAAATMGPVPSGMGSDIGRPDIVSRQLGPMSSDVGASLGGVGTGMGGVFTGTLNNEPGRLPIGQLMPPRRRGLGGSLAGQAAMASMGGMKKGGAVKKMAKGGSVSSASKRADGCAVKGKTKGRFV